MTSFVNILKDFSKTTMDGEDARFAHQASVIHQEEDASLCCLLGLKKGE